MKRKQKRVGEKLYRKLYIRCRSMAASLKSSGRNTALKATCTRCMQHRHFRGTSLARNKQARFVPFEATFFFVEQSFFISPEHKPEIQVYLWIRGLTWRIDSSQFISDEFHSRYRYNIIDAVNNIFNHYV